MSKPPRADIWMPLYIADYARDTLHLTRDQHGGYFLLLMACWNGGGRLPNSAGALAAITKSTPQEWARLKRALLPFFRADGEWLTHKRVLEEREKAARLSAARQATGARGGRPKKQTESKPKAIANLEGNLEGLQTETPARVVVVVDSSELTTTSVPSQVSATDSQGHSSVAEVVPLAGRAGR